MIFIPLILRRFISVEIMKVIYIIQAFFRPISQTRHSKTKVILTIHENL